LLQNTPRYRSHPGPSIFTCRKPHILWAHFPLVRIYVPATFLTILFLHPSFLLESPRWRRVPYIYYFAPLFPFAHPPRLVCNDWQPRLCALRFPPPPPPSSVPFAAGLPTPLLFPSLLGFFFTTHRNRGPNRWMLHLPFPVFFFSLPRCQFVIPALLCSVFSACASILYPPDLWNFTRCPCCASRLLAGLEDSLPPAPWKDNPVPCHE